MELTLRAAGQYAVTVSVGEGGGGGEFFAVVALEVGPVHALHGRVAARARRT